MTTNRMGLEQLSDERLEQYANDKRMCNVNDEIREMARELLAYRKASREPAYFINKVTYGDDVELRIYCYELDAMKSKDDFGGVVIPLYAAPPLQAVTVPDGWIKCIDRMPDVGDIVLTSKDGCVNVGEMERSGANYRYFTSVVSGRELPSTHWMPLPAAPTSVTNEP